MQNFVDRLLLLLKALSGSNGFSPEMLVFCLQFFECSVNCFLLHFDCGNFSSQRSGWLCVGNAAGIANGGICSARGWRWGCGFWIFRSASLSSDLGEEIWVIFEKMQMFEFPGAVFLQVWDFVKAVHVQLSDKRRKIVVFAVAWEDLA